MGYIQLGSGIGNFSRFIISDWFRIPSSTFAVMSAISDDPGTFQSDHMVSICYNPPLFKVIPLVVLGSVQTDNFANPVQPSFIGIDCWGGFNTLACNLQTPVNGSVSGDGAAGPPRPGCFYMSGYTTLGAPTNTSVAPDVWHHALISGDISGSETAFYPVITGSEPPPSFGGTSTFSWALDDVGKVGPSMGPSGGGTYTGLANNVIVTNWPIDSTAADLSVNPLSVSFSGGHIASSGNPVGIPSSSVFVANNQNIQRGPFQMFTGISADATDSSVRRLFVTADGKPASQTLAQASFGQAPVIRFDTLIDWRTGRNRGSGGNFETTGAIESYSPGPDLTP